MPQRGREPYQRSRRLAPSSSFAGTRHPRRTDPSNGSVSDSTFSDIYVAGVWIAAAVTC